MLKRILPALLPLVLAACASTPALPPEITAPEAGHVLETVVIMGINDLHGALAPQAARTREAPGAETVAYEKGGATILAAHVRELRKEFGPRFLLLDAGDQFQGSIESNLAEGAPMVAFFNAIGVNAAAIGNHEFDFGPVGPEGATGDPLGALKARMSEAHYPYLAANIVEAGTDRLPAFPGALKSTILTAGTVKVGVIGLTTPETPLRTRAEFVRGLEFTELKTAALEAARALREKGAQLVLIVAHSGLRCQLGRAGAASHFRKEQDPQGDCDEKDEIPRLLRELPPGTVDGVVSGHTHTIVHHFLPVGGGPGAPRVPVIQGGTRAQAYNLMYLTYDLTAGKVLPARTRIEGPVPICPLVFENQGDCNGERPAPRNGRGSLVTPRIHNHSIRADGDVEALLKPVFARTEAEKSRVVGQAVRPLSFTKMAESDVGNLVADALRWKAHTDFGVINAGGMRSAFESGPVTYEALFRAIPYDNSVTVLKLTGKELRLLLRVAENGSRGVFPVSGLRLRLVEAGAEPTSSDLNGDGRISPWEINRLIEATRDDGTALRDTASYTVATVDYLAKGGDDWEWLMSRIPADRITVIPGGLLRNAVADYMTQAGPLNSVEKPLADEREPRLRFEKPKKKGRARHRRKRR